MASRRTTKKKAHRTTGKKAQRMSVRITIRIKDHVVVEDDRHVEVKRKDKVKWQNLTGGNDQVVFGSRTDPFTPGKVIDVPGNGESEEEVIRGLPGGIYKYSVVRVSDDVVTDDPNIIIRS